MRLLLIVVALLGATSVFGWWWQSRQGRAVAAVGPRRLLGAASIGVQPGERVTFVQLSSSVCAPCRATALVLGRLATERPGVVHVELDVAENLDLVRQFDVLRTPTTLVLDREGAVVSTLHGALTRPQALAVLDGLADLTSCTGTAR